MTSMFRYRVAQFFCFLVVRSRLSRRWVRFHARRGRVTSFYLHNPSQHLFTELLLHAERLGFRFISAGQLSDRIDQRAADTRPLLFLSIDDGWGSVLGNVARVAELHRAPVAYFIATEPLSSGDFWWRRVAPQQVDPLKRVPNAARVDALSACPPCAHRAALSWAELRRLHRMRHATIGNHTHNHPILPNCTEAEIAHEIGACHDALQAGLGEAPAFFAYPNGDPGGGEEALLARLGYRLAFTVDAGFVEPGKAADRYRLPRFAGNENGSVHENVCRMIGLWPYRSWLRRR